MQNTDKIKSIYLNKCILLSEKITDIYNKNSNNSILRTNKISISAEIKSLILQINLLKNKLPDGNN